MAGNYGAGYNNSNVTTQGLQTNLSLSGISFNTNDEMTLGGVLTVISSSVVVRARDAIYIAIKLLKTDPRSGSSTSTMTSVYPFTDAEKLDVALFNVARYKIANDIEKQVIKTGAYTLPASVDEYSAVDASSASYIDYASGSPVDMNGTSGGYNILVVRLVLSLVYDTTLNPGDYISFMVGEVGLGIDTATSPSRNHLCNWLAIPLGFSTAAGTVSGTPPSFTVGYPTANYPSLTDYV